MIKNKTVTAIVLIAGNSTRYGKDINKNFELLNKKPVFTYSIDAFDHNKYIDNIILVCKEDEINKTIKYIKNLNKDIKIITGGETRQESVYNGIINTDEDIVIIHDGARPLIKQEYINKCIEEMEKYKGATIGVKSKDTIKISDENNVVINTTERNNTWIIQTPQCFERNVLLKMHEEYKEEEVTDDCMLLEKGEYQVKIIEGDYTNLKITTSEDLKIIKEIIKTEKN